MNRAILFFVKHPVPGNVKTRLSTQVGAGEAATIYRLLVETACKNLPANCDLIVLFDPPDAHSEIESWLRPFLPGSVRFQAQTGKDLGERLISAFKSATGYEKLAAIGSDCIELTPAVWEEAWEALETNDVTIGPCPDGGYYLIALKRLEPTLFRDIEWSSERTLLQTLARAQKRHLSVHQLPELTDVDTLADWERARRFLARQTHPN